MALIKCPDCGKGVSDTALKCINCGRTMKKSFTLESLVMIFLISLVIPISGLIIYLIGKLTSNEDVAKAGIRGFLGNIVLVGAIIILGAVILANG